MPGVPESGVGGMVAYPLAAWEKLIFRYKVVKSLWENAIPANFAFPAPLGEGNY